MNEYQKAATAQGFAVYEFENDGGELDGGAGVYFLWGKDGTADGGESYDTEAEAWEGCCDANDIEIVHTPVIINTEPEEQIFA